MKTQDAAFQEIKQDFKLHFREITKNSLSSRTPKQIDKGFTVFSISSSPIKAYLLPKGRTSYPKKRSAELTQSKLSGKPQSTLQIYSIPLEMIKVYPGHIMDHQKSQ